MKKCWRKEDGNRLFFIAREDGMRRNGLKLQKRKIMMDIRKTLNYEND